MGVRLKHILVCLLAVLTGCRFSDGNHGDIRTRSEIAWLGSSLKSFKQRFGLCPPSRIKLSETANYPQRDQPGTLDADSVEFLTRVWPQLRLEPGAGIDWNGDGQVQGDWVLEGDECLVFFLGGLP